MSDIHNLIISEGIVSASNQVEGRAGKSLVKIAASILSEESQAIGMTYSGFCLTSLPHNKLPDDQIWERHGHNIRLVIDPGLIDINGKSVRIGVPYGINARIILYYLQTKAVKSRSPKIELGGSFAEWIRRMGLSDGGKQRENLAEQIKRISACNLVFFWKTEEAKGMKRSAFVNEFIMLDSKRSSNDNGWRNEITLNEDFFKSLVDHPVPIWEPAVIALKNKSMAFDIYIWLAYRLHVLTKATPITWSAIQDQFGAGFSTVRSFRQKFKESLEFAKAVYPDACVDVTETGVTLYPSRPPVDHKVMVSLAGKARAR